VPDDWSGFEVTLRLPRGRGVLKVGVTNPDRCSEAVVRASMDGRPLAVRDGAALVPLDRPDSRGETRRVDVILGRAPAGGA
jgi:hypothetical protein